MENQSYTFVPFDANTLAGSVAIGNRATPSSQDWERHRPLIKRLYVDQRKPLKEVAAIMVQQGHHATERMYKTRLKNWRLDRNNKESDMLAIIRKKTERDAIGKETAFRVRGQTVNIEQVLHYFKRKKIIRDSDAYNAPTPSDVSYQTPLPIPVDRRLQGDNEMAEMDLSSWKDETLQNQGSLSIFSSKTPDHANLVNVVSTTTPGFFVDETIIQMTLQDMYSIRSPASIPASPSTPPTLHVSERLFFTIKTHLDGSLSSDVGDIPNVLTDFYHYCFTASDLVKPGMHTEFRRSLSKAFRLVEEIIQLDHPSTLDYILEVFLMFQQRGQKEVYQMLKRYISVRASFIRGKPWPRIYQLIGMIEDDSFEQAMIQSWRCSLDSMENILGKFHIASLQSNLSFIDRVYRTSESSFVEGEAHIRRLLSQCEEFSGGSSWQTLRSMTRLGWNLYYQFRYEEVEALGLDILSRVLGRTWPSEEAEALKIVAWCQHRQGKYDLAEDNLQRAIRLTVDEYGREDPVAVKYMVDFEDWLREWGRDEEANELRATINEAIGRDEVDKELEGVSQSL